MFHPVINEFAFVAKNGGLIDLGNIFRPMTFKYQLFEGRDILQRFVDVNYLPHICKLTALSFSLTCFLRFNIKNFCINTRLSNFGIVISFH